MVEDIIKSEVEWLSCPHPAKMLAHLTHQEGDGGSVGMYDISRGEMLVSDRKLRLIREAWESPLCGRWRKCVGCAGILGQSESLRQCVEVEVNMGTEYKPVAANLLREIIGNPHNPVRIKTRQVCSRCGYGGDLPNRKYCNRGGDPQGKNAHHWVAVPDKTWFTSAVVEMARYAYDNRDFTGLPVVADALEEAGCTEAAILNHLRGKEDCPKCWGSRKYAPYGLCLDCGQDCQVDLRCGHVRGCWALDLLLGLE